MSTREIVLTHETACTPSLKVDKLGITSSKPESEHQFVAKTESESKLRENQLFKEKSVAAWVRAIPGRSLNENNQEFQDNRKLTSKCEVARTHTEREFLKNIKKDSTMFKTTHSNPLKIIDNSSNWNMDHIQSPIFSPHMPPHKPLQPVKSNEEVERENEATKFGHSSLPWNEPWQNNQLMGNNWGENHPKVL